jgi:hypothetical protein
MKPRVLQGVCQQPKTANRTNVRHLENGPLAVNVKPTIIHGLHHVLVEPVHIELTDKTAKLAMLRRVRLEKPMGSITNVHALESTVTAPCARAGQHHG